MKSGVPSDPEAITAVLDRFDAVQAEVASLSFDALTAPRALTVKDRLEMVSRRQAAVHHRLTHQLTPQASPVELGDRLGGGGVQDLEGTHPRSYSLSRS